MSANTACTPSASGSRSARVLCSDGQHPVHVARRGVLLGAVPAVQMLLSRPASARLELPNKEVDNDTSPFVQELLRRTQEKKEERYQQRLQDYYKRNFKEYFEFEAGSVKTGRARGISANTQQEILKWLEENK
eukprot:CAMPEP_0202903854 /NCGR_PEP_ID=MMETSP1392-20130828/26679_1 /ASSEMBLY_ACC=CAM_ASM_000868 /TAXON_ID=225041 /ORGANISM="Chlamydomonas chlamydogama, Strain SAG 11-48b" /LENGTH=132 /DNA_ID=CAMNT_0049591201 /DNA_START=19 /DNA_END=417 /DNA_ORIENTATION=+